MGKPVDDIDILCLNDQGGGFMAVSYNYTGTLRSQLGGHPPLVLLYKDVEDIEYGSNQCG